MTVGLTRSDAIVREQARAAAARMRQVSVARMQTAIAANQVGVGQRRHVPVSAKWTPERLAWMRALYPVADMLWLTGRLNQMPGATCTMKEVRNAAEARGLKRAPAEVQRAWLAARSA